MIDAHYDFLQKCIDVGVADKLVLEYNSNITNIILKSVEHMETF